MAAHAREQLNTFYQLAITAEITKKPLAKLRRDTKELNNSPGL